MTRPQSRQGGDVGDLLSAIVVIGLAALAFGHWLIGNVAALIHSGHPLRGVSLVQALQALWGLPDHGGDPRRAWPPALAAQLPGPVLYWTSTALVLSTLAAVGLLGLRLFSGVPGGSSRAGTRRREPIDRRRRLGVPT